MKKFYLLTILFLSCYLSAQLTQIKSLAADEVPDTDVIMEKQIFKGKMYYFSKKKSTQSCKLFVTDGTADGTVLLKDLGAIYTTGSNNYSITGDFNQTDNLLFFTRSQHLNPTLGGTPTEITSELWVTDGTSAGTLKLLSKTNTGYTVFPMFLFGDSFGTHPKNQNFVGDKLIFTAYDPDNSTIYWGNQIAWVSDGTVAGTKPLLTNDGEKIFDGSAGGTKLNGEYYFGGRMQATIDPGGYLFKTDGTSAGTVIVNPSEANFYIASTFSEPLNGKFLFWATNNLGTYPQTNYEIWESDGTATGTKLFLETAAGFDSQKTYYLNALDFVNDGKQIYFMRQPDAADNFNSEVWVTDITLANTKKLRDKSNYLNTKVKIGNGFIYFDEYTLPAGSGSQYRLSYSDGTLAGTYVVSAKNTQHNSMALYNGSLFFKDYDQLVPYFSNNVQDNMEVWRSDSKADNTKRVLDIYPGTQTVLSTTISNDSKPTNFFVLGNALYFTAQNPKNQHKLYKFFGDYTFTGAADTNWSNASNWLATATPGLNDVVNIPSGYNVTVDANAYAKDLNLMSPLNLLSGDLNVSGDLVVDSKITLNNNHLNLTGSVSNAEGNSTNYIVTNSTGSVNVENLDATRGTISIPIGTSTNYNPVSISNTGTSDTFSARVSDTSDFTNGGINATWEIFETTAGGSNVNLTLGWNTAQEQSGFSPTTAKIVHKVSGVWNEENSGTVSGTNPYTITATGITEFSPFSVAVPSLALGTSNISKSKVSVYPNPFNENLNISTQENGVVYFYDLSGKLVSTSMLMKGSNVLNKSSLEKGIYLYQIKGEEGSTIASGKVIKN